MSTDYNNLAQLHGNREGTTYIFSRLPWEKVRFVVISFYSFKPFIAYKLFAPIGG